MLAQYSVYTFQGNGFILTTTQAGVIYSLHICTHRKFLPLPVILTKSTVYTFERTNFIFLTTSITQSSVYVFLE